MAVSKQQFLDMLVSDLDREIEAAEAEAKKNPHVFSDRFEKSMEKMIRTGKPDKLWSEDYSDSGAKKRKLSKRGLKVLLIAAAILLALTAVACAVPEIRESIAGFFVRIFSDHVEYVDPAITKDRIEEEYGLVPVPDGFEVINCSKTDTENVTTYSDLAGNTIVLVQNVREAIDHSVDIEQGVFFERSLDGKSLRIYFSEKSAQASWMENGYYFSLSYSSQIDEKAFEAIVRLVKKL